MLYFLFVVALDSPHFIFLCSSWCRGVWVFQWSRPDSLGLSKSWSWSWRGGSGYSLEWTYFEGEHWDRFYILILTHDAYTKNILILWKLSFT